MSCPEIKEAIKAGRADHEEAIEIIEKLVVLENEAVKTKYKYNYTNIDR